MSHAAGTRSAGIDEPMLPPVGYRFVRTLAFAAVLLVLTTALNTRPRPGLRGDHLAVAAALVVIAVATGVAVRMARDAPRLLTPLLIMIAVASGVLVGLQPNGPGFFGVFPAVTAGALRLPVRLSSMVTTVAIATLGVAWAIAGHRPAAGVLLNEFGIIAFYLVALMARRLREANDRAQRLIAELEDTRDAQAQAAALAERQRLSREMHDVLAHSLSGLVLNLDAARLLARQDGADPRVGAAIERAHRLAKSGLDEARSAIAVLRDDALPGPDRLASLAAEFEDDMGVPCTFVRSGAERDLGSDGRLTLYRVAQEALTNIRKHACAERVDMRLDFEPGGTRLVVEDVEGTSQAVPLGGGSGYGLTGMRERAELLGGTLAAGPTENGFRVELWVPA